MNGPDKTDRMLLDLLQDDDRQSLAALSKATGVPASTINDRIRRLTRQGLIAGFHARLPPDALGYNLLAFMMVGRIEGRLEAAFLERVRRAPQVLECHCVSGAWSYLLKVRVATTRDLEGFLADTVHGADGIGSTEVIIVLSSVKETWKLSVAAE